MPQVTLFDSGAAITGSGGFIGTRLADVLGCGSLSQSYSADVCSLEELRRLGRDREIHSLFHLAAAGTVLTDFSKTPRMLDVSVTGGLNAIEAFRPLRVIYSSTCAIYGNAPAGGGSPIWDDVHPISIYGLSKAITEKILERWARRTGSTAVLLRLGNVIGSGCGGLITYLVRHAIRFPDGSVPASMRGGGRIVRDYVPVDYAVQIMRLALDLKIEPGGSPIFNVGSGITMSNGEIAAIVKRWLAVQGYELNIEFQPDPGDGESLYSGLKTDSTERAFGLRPSTSEEVREAVVEGARSFLDRETSRLASSGGNRAIVNV